MLAGDAMQALAFEVLTPAPADADGLPPLLQARLCGLLARAAGHEGMAGGQAIDLASIGLPLNEPQLRDMHRRKTGALLQASVLMGAACGEMPARGLGGAVAPTARPSGLAFQVVDDILDVTQASETLGQDGGQGRRPQQAHLCVGARPRGRARSGASVARTCTGRARRQRLAAHCAPESGWPTWWSTARTEVSMKYRSRCWNRSISPRTCAVCRAASCRKLARELREFVLQSVSKTGGHLSSNLGTVELTIALHYVYDTPHDRIVWDVGHQTYPHKILTGRRERMHTLRQLDGIGGFPRRDESEYDTFGTAHSSTSISAALGMALAAKLKGEEPQRGGGDRRRRVVRRHGLRGAQQRRLQPRPGPRRHAGDPERQRHVDQPAGRCAQQVPGAADERQVLRRRARGRASRC